MKNHLLKHLQVTRVGPASDVRDPGFNAMKDPALILWAIVGVFNTAGYSVTIRDREAILKYGKEALASAGQAVYDLFLRHQMQRKIEQAMTKAAGGLADEDEVRRVAEQYIGKSKAEVTRMQEDIYLKDSIISGLERYVQELADERDAAIKQKALLAAPNGVRRLKVTADMPNEYDSEARPTQPGLDSASTMPKPTRSRRPDVKMEGGGTKMQQEAPPTPFSSGDYLADTYDACVGQDRLVNSAARLPREAGLAYDRPENARPHVRQFISSCEDPELARQLAGLRLSNEEELRDVLKQLLYQSMRAKRGDIVKGRTSKRDQDQARELREGRPKERNAKPAQLGSKGRPIQVYELNGTSSDDPEYSDSDVSDEESDLDPHDVNNDGQAVDSITRDDDRGVDRLEPTRQDAVELLSKGCGKIHDRGECPLEEIANQLRACRKYYRQMIVPAKINDRSARVLLDSGAEVSIIDSTFVRKADIEIDHSEQLRCAGVGGSAFHTEGKARIKVTLGGELAMSGSDPFMALTLYWGPIS
ncbi:hypothetical protein ATCC90586_008735 [Pythium insidiosum]|nr:hypothetical protein ATCC90586_008735 [Pythium insidiosum]